ncbi:sugar transferase [Streptococcus sp. zg-JUN1979]|uniref:sugar transferase n=1 Tax=Streptococcus sp. zg-JUN1979 TaxID=3391450 RepID=UPI0039A4BCCF
MYSESSLQKILYLCVDAVAILVTFLCLSLVFHYHFLLNPRIWLISIIISLIYAVWSDHYTYIVTRPTPDEFKFATRFSLLFLVVTILVIAATRFLSKDEIALIKASYLFSQLSVGIVLVFSLRLILKYLAKKWIRVTSNVILVTNFTEDSDLLDSLKSNGYRVLAYFSQAKASTATLDIPILTDFEQIRYLLSHNEVEEVFVANDAFRDFNDKRDYFNALGIPVSLAFPNGLTDNLSSMTWHNIGRVNVLTSSLNHSHYRSLFIKRACDIIISLAGLLLTGLVALIIYPIVQRQSKGPLIFKQKRVGKNGKIFNIYKFRSMYLDAEERKKEMMKANQLNTDLMFKMDNDPRIFSFGQKLRDWSLDELPQFINVLKGDMSFIGTRPPTLNEYEKYELHHFKRLAMKPGITGMWQVSGRSNIIDFEQVVALDLYYIKNWSLWLDIKIFFKTIKVVLGREGSK